MTPRLAAHEKMYREAFLWEKASHPATVLFLIKSGSFELTMRGEKSTVSENDGALFPSGEPFSRRIISPVTFHFIQLAPPDRGDALPLPAGRIRFADIKRIQSTIGCLDTLADFPDQNRKQWRQHLLDDLFFQIDYEARAPAGLQPARLKDEIVRKAGEYFQKNMQHKISVGELSRELGVTHAMLIDKFKGELGRGPVAQLTLLRVDKAKHLLLNSELPVSRIAELCGFSNRYYFSRAFKKHTRHSPSDYRAAFRV